jgi:hypothetical protein
MIVNEVLAREATNEYTVSHQPPYPHPNWREAPGALLHSEAAAFGWWKAHESEGFHRPEPWRDGWWLVRSPNGKPVTVEPLKTGPMYTPTPGSSKQRARLKPEDRRRIDRTHRHRRAEVEREERVEEQRQQVLF